VQYKPGENNMSQLPPDSSRLEDDLNAIGMMTVDLVATVSIEYRDSLKSDTAQAHHSKEMKDFVKRAVGIGPANISAYEAFSETGLSGHPWFTRERLGKSHTPPFKALVDEAAGEKQLLGFCHRTHTYYPADSSGKKENYSECTKLWSNDS